MKYFTKYLPVEGEIKEGDWFTWRDEGTDTPYLFKCIGLTDDTHLQVKWDKEIGCYWNNSPNEAGYGDWNKAFAKKVKLFLCSRDIQVGDKVQFQIAKNATWKELNVLEVYHDNGYTIVLKDDDLKIHTTPDATNQCFKVIGEISPDAVWVKEGDELDETQIAIRKWNIVYIKCPTCGRLQ